MVKHKQQSDKHTDQHLAYGGWSLLSSLIFVLLCFLFTYTFTLLLFCLFPNKHPTPEFFLPIGLSLITFLPKICMTYIVT